MQTDNKGSEIIPEGCWGLDEAEEMTTDSISKLEEIIARSFELKKEIDEMEKMEITPRKEEMRKLDEKIRKTLEKYDKKSYRTNVGMVTRVESKKVSFPKDPDVKSKLREYMGADTYFEMSSINYQSFRSWYNQERESAIEQGASDFKIEGIKEEHQEWLTKRT